MFCALFSSNAYTGSGVSYTCERIASSLSDAGIRTRVVVPFKTQESATATIIGGVPAALRKPLRPWRTALAERRYFRELTASTDPNRIAYLWPDASLRLAQKIKQRGIPIVREMINCHVATAREILREAYARHGLVNSSISEAHVAYEQAFLQLCDYIVSPSANVAASLEANGVPSSKIISSSYGWEPARVGSAAAHPRSHADGLQVLFVGTLNIRKGVDTLLDAWRMSGIKGKLTLVGALTPELQSILASAAQENVTHVPFTTDVAPHFAAADIFVMPSLEEGGPLVTYEACGAGLPIIATPMGAGNVVRNGENGIVVPPAATESLAEAFLFLDRSADVRQRYARRSRAIANDFTWRRVGEALAAKLLASMDS